MGIVDTTPGRSAQPSNSHRTKYTTAMPKSETPARTPWPAIALLYMAGALAALQYAKIPLMLPGLLLQTPMSPVQQAIVLSIIGMVGAIAGTFAGAVCQAVGLRRTLVLGLAVGTAGALLPLAASAYPMLLLARAIESVAHMAIVVAVPTLMLSLCSPTDRPRVMAMWSCYFTVTFISAALVAPAVLHAAGWQGLAMLHAALMAVVGLLCWRLPLTDVLIGARQRLSAQDILKAQFRLLRQGKLLAVPATFFGYTLLFVALVSVLPRLLASTPAQTTQLAMALPCASLVGTLLSMAALSRGIAGYRIVVWSALCIVLTGASLVFLPKQGLATLCMVMVTFVLLGTLPAGVISSIPALFTPGDPDITLVNGGLVQFGNLGNFVGSPILAALLVQFGWASVGAYLLAGGMIASICLVFLRRSIIKAQLS
jgi:MFS transporter, DHA1 family, inner membrane transport protein